MPDRRRSHCGECGGHRDTVGPITWGGYCIECGKARHLRNTDELHDHEGPFYQRWRYGMTRALLGVEVANALYGAGAFQDDPAV